MIIIIIIIIIPENFWLVCLDVSSLYTNIPTQQGLRVISDLLDRNRSTYAYKPSNESLINLLELVLTKNNFQFNGHHYIQKKGVAMGSKVSPSFAILYMDFFERTHVYTYHKQPYLYLRYIDDIFLIWQHQEEELHQFIDFLNTREPSIKFTSHISQSEATFLDMQIIRTPNGIKTDLYTKPTDSHDYLLYSSAHPQKCKDSIPYSQFLRIRRICSDILDYDKNVIMLSKHFLRRKYPIELIEDAALTVRRLDRDSLLAPKVHKHEQNTNVFFITTFNPRDDTARTIVQKNWPILGTSPTTLHIYQRKLMTGYRRPKNLRDMLVKALIKPIPGDEQSHPNYVHTEPTQTECSDQKPSQSLRQTTLDQFITTTTNTNTSPISAPSTSAPNTSRQGTSAKERGFSFCNTPTCRYCKLICKSGKITSYHTKETYNCMKKISCRSSNVIYCLTCTNCGKQYVGQTLRRIKDRLYEHLKDIDSLNKEKPLGLHFYQSCRKNPEIKCHILEFIKKPPRSPEAQIIRDRIEKRWIHLLKTPVPLGLNIED